MIKGMLGKLPIEIAKLIHVYVFDDVLKELLAKYINKCIFNDILKELLEETRVLRYFNNRLDANHRLREENYHEPTYFHIFGLNPGYICRFLILNLTWYYGNIYEQGGSLCREKDLTMINDKIKFLKRYYGEYKFECGCGNLLSISEYKEDAYPYECHIKGICVYTGKKLY